MSKPRTIYDLRSAVTELIYLLREWEMPDAEVMIQALWLINLAGVPNSGIHRKMTSRVLELMREVARGKVDPLEALNTMKEWEIHE